MSAKEKAKELFDKMYSYQLNTVKSNTPILAVELAKECALIAVDEILDECTYWAGGINIDWENGRFKYWEQVKAEIEKL